MLEELFWENSYSSYNFYDYMSISKDAQRPQTSSGMNATLSGYFRPTTLGVDSLPAPLVDAALTDISTTGNFYANSIQLEDSLAVPSLTPTNHFSVLPVHGDLSDMDDSFYNYKSITALINKFSSPTIGASSSSVGARSYLSVFNYFRSDYEDFN
jgi:hypothetical protein